VLVHKLDELVYHFKIYVVALREHFGRDEPLRVDDFTQDFNIVIACRLSLQIAFSFGIGRASRV
jgi:hypothetical protein